MRIGAAVAALLTAMPVASAACPIELATYSETETGIAVEFRPTVDSATVTNSFRFLAGDVVMDGIVMWTAGAPRSWGVIMDGCPVGDLTGAEISACTVWEGVIYAADESGRIGLVPAEGEAAPATLILSDLGGWLSQSDAWSRSGLAALPSDIVKLSGCQE